MKLFWGNLRAGNESARPRYERDGEFSAFPEVSRIVAKEEMCQIGNLHWELGHTIDGSFMGRPISIYFRESPTNSLK